MKATEKKILIIEDTRKRTPIKVNKSLDKIRTATFTSGKTEDLEKVEIVLTF